METLGEGLGRHRASGDPLYTRRSTRHHDVYPQRSHVRASLLWLPCVAHSRCQDSMAEKKCSNRYVALARRHSNAEAVEINYAGEALRESRGDRI